MKLPIADCRLPIANGYADFPELERVDTRSWRFAAQFLWQGFLYTAYCLWKLPLKRWLGFPASLLRVADHEARVACALADEPDDDLACDLLDRLDARYDEIIAAEERNRQSAIGNRQ